MPASLNGLAGWLLPALILCLPGCAGIPSSVSELPEPGYAVELAETPFFPQEKYQCGPAALATALQSSDVNVQPDDLVASVYLPGREGSLQVDMLAATRSAGRIPYRLRESLAAIAAELDDGRPVVVLQNLGVSLIPRWHYAVVVGIDEPNDAVLLRSGTEKRRETPIRPFLRTWARGEYWAFSVLRPGELPAAADRDRYVEAVAAVEQVGMLEEAAVAWRAALERWPSDAVAQFGLGNTMLELGRAGDAVRVYRDLLTTKPELVVARNNLSLALLKLGRHTEAMTEIDNALGQLNNDALRAELLDTKREIERAQRQ